MILDLLYYHPHILAVNTNGQLLTWNTTVRVPLLSSSAILRLQSQPLLGIIDIPYHIVAYAECSLYLIQKDRLNRVIETQSLELI